MMMKRFLLFAGTMRFSALGTASVDAYNVVWNSPSKDSAGSMPMGMATSALMSGERESGDLVFYVGKD